MIVRPRPGLLRLFFILRGSVLQRIFPQVVVVLALSGAVVLAHRSDPGRIPSFDGAPFALLGIALSVFLGFSNNACYDRWWEARKAWGQLIAVARDLLRQTLLLEQRGPEAVAGRRRLVDLAIAFPHALVVHLREGAPTADLLRVLPAGLSQTPPGVPDRFLPDRILREMGAVLARLRSGGHLSDMEFVMLDGILGRMTEALTTCERIKSTPVPFGYTLLLHRTAYLFCFLLPFGFADVLGWGTPLAAALVAYTFFGLDALGSELEEPFGTLPNDLPIAALATGIEIILREGMGESGLPAAPEPVDFMLL
ncbi:bestrophin family protein [Xanthobacter versatilis]|uniref:bestrophin family protein n=1 Tax=Xanthobacter autotrophicus (strain ATCC BAA-1158 / Py2) TaxID=78245 RepID=UPI003727AE3B